VILRVLDNSKKIVVQMIKAVKMTKKRKRRVILEIPKITRESRMIKKMVVIILKLINKNILFKVAEVYLRQIQVIRNVLEY
jgi:hypothetical protein